MVKGHIIRFYVILFDESLEFLLVIAHFACFPFQGLLVPSTEIRDPVSVKAA